jgi:hypothetical protein
VVFCCFLQTTVNIDDENQHGQQNQHVETENSDVIEFEIESAIQQVDDKTSEVIDVENDEQQTPLHVAAKSGSVACVKYLIRANANVGARDKDFKTPLHLAAEQGQVECVEELAKVSDVNAQDYNLNTPLHLVAKNNVSAFLFLLKHQNIDTSLTNRNFKTAKELALDHLHFSNKPQKQFSIRIREQKKESKMNETTNGDKMVYLLNLAGIRVTKGKKTRGDGNCFYRAVADQSPTSWTHSMLRKTVVEHVEKEFNKPPNLRSETMNVLVGCHESENSFREMIEEQKKNKVWANETFIVYTANLLGIAIRVFKIENDVLKSDYLFPSLLMTESEVDKTSQICLVHYNQHFQNVVLVRSNDAANRTQ